MPSFGVGLDLRAADAGRTSGPEWPWGWVRNGAVGRCDEGRRWADWIADARLLTAKNSVQVMMPRKMPKFDLLELLQNCTRPPGAV
jgi:hypothetical protein